MISSALNGNFVRGIAADEEGCYSADEKGTAAACVLKGSRGRGLRGCRQSAIPREATMSAILCYRGFRNASG